MTPRNSDDLLRNITATLGDPDFLLRNFAATASLRYAISPFRDLADSSSPLVVLPFYRYGVTLGDRPIENLTLKRIYRLERDARASIRIRSTYRDSFENHLETDVYHAPVSFLIDLISLRYYWGTWKARGRWLEAWRTELRETLTKIERDQRLAESVDSTWKHFVRVAAEARCSPVRTNETEEHLPIFVWM